MSKVVEFPLIPLWYPNIDSVEFTLNETNFLEFTTKTLLSVISEKCDSEVDWGQLLDDIKEGIEEYGEVILNDDSNIFYRG